MKKSLLALASIACLGMFAVGCGDDDESACENFPCAVGQECALRPTILGKKAACRQTDETCAALGDYVFSEYKWTCVEKGTEGQSGETEDGLCHKDSDCDETIEYCDTATGWCEEKEEDAYRYVRVDDMSPVKSDGEDPGADIDAIVLQKKNGGQKFFAAAVRGYSRGDGTSTKEKNTIHAFDPEAVIGAPDSIVDYTNPDGNCNYLNKDKTGFTFVSLGGKGGFVIAQMEGNIENGDTIYITEVGDCKLVASTTQSGSSSNAGAENFSVSVSISDAIDGDWKVIISDSTAKKGVVNATVAGL